MQNNVVKIIFVPTKSKTKHVKPTTVPLSFDIRYWVTFTKPTWAI